MANRYKRRELPPEPALIAEYLAAARPSGLRESRRETERVQAVRALHAFYLQWQREVAAAVIARRSPKEQAETIEELCARYCARGAPPNFDGLLRAFFDHASRLIWASPDPPAAMRVFWCGIPRRGRPPEVNAGRNLDLAVAVQQRIDAGASAEDAIAAVADESRPLLCAETIHKIYYAVGRTAARAELALRALRDPTNWRTAVEEEQKG